MSFSNSISSISSLLNKKSSQAREDDDDYVGGNRGLYAATQLDLNNNNYQPSHNSTQYSNHSNLNNNSTYYSTNSSSQEYQLTSDFSQSSRSDERECVENMKVYINELISKNQETNMSLNRLQEENDRLSDKLDDYKKLFEKIANIAKKHNLGDFFGQCFDDYE